MGWTYERAGVDLGKHGEMHRVAKETIARLARELGIELSEAPFTRFMRLGNLEITLHVDGVGTKALIAWATRKLGVLGWDCVVGNVNDIACDGAKPLALVDYIALSSNDVDAVAQILEGIEEASIRAKAPLLGGEVAIMPDLINGIDVSCTILGVRAHAQGQVGEGDVVVGVESNGLHMNGYTLARKVLLSKYSLSDEVCGNTLANELLRPTHYYGDLLLSLYGKGILKAAINVTGGGFGKARRILGPTLGMEVTPPEPPCIFKEIQRLGKVDLGEMYKVFNMGIGLMLIVEEDKVKDALGEIEEHGFRHWVMGQVVRNGGKIVVNAWNGEHIVL